MEADWITTQIIPVGASQRVDVTPRVLRGRLDQDSSRLHGQGVGKSHSTDEPRLP
jgi:hypothetical protein